jgi:adenosylcobyric acid synthase
MLGKTLSDPEQVEEGGAMRGMGIFPMDTVFLGEKTRTRVNGTFQKLKGVLSDLSGIEVEGYEIHMGISKLEQDLCELTSIQNQKETDIKLDGAFKDNVYGSYIHGIFDKEQVAKTIVQSLAKEKGITMDEIAVMDYAKFKETQYDILADTLRKHLDMKKIYEILEMGV